MRMLSVAVAVGVLVAGVGVVAADDAKPANTFSGIKLVDMKARTPEQTVTVTVGQEHVRVIDPTTKKELKTFALSGRNVTHTESNTPPAAAGSPESAQVQRGEAPMHLARQRRMAAPHAVDEARVAALQPLLVQGAPADEKALGMPVPFVDGVRAAGGRAMCRSRHRWRG